MLRTPWKYATGASLKGRFHAVENFDGILVAECYEGDEAEQEANAKMIAAAPDMLAALRLVQCEFDNLPLAVHVAIDEAIRKAIPLT